MTVSVKYIFLAILYDGALHGYELKNRYTNLLDKDADINFGQVYTTLARLERDGFVALTESGEPDRKVYEITAIGRESLGNWLKSDSDNLKTYDDFSYKLTALKIIGTHEYIKMVENYKTELIKKLQSVSRKKLEAKRTDLGLYLALERCALKMQADIQWAERCIELLTSQKEV